MEFDFEQFTILSREPFLKMFRNKAQFFKICEKRNQSKIFTLIIMEGDAQIYAEQLKTHLQCQSITKSALNVKGYKQMDSTDTFGFKIERTGWLVENVQTTLENFIQDIRLQQVCMNPGGMFESPSSEQLALKNGSNLKVFLPHQLLMKLLKELSNGLAELQQEEISITALQMQSIVVTAASNFKIFDLSSALNTMGMQNSVNRQIQGNSNYFDPETHRASLEGEVYLSQNYFKSSVYALGLILIEAGTMQVFDRRQTVQETIAHIEVMERQYGSTIGRVLRAMLQPKRQDRPDCVQLVALIDDDSLELSPDLRPPDLFRQTDTLAFTGSLVPLQQELMQMNINVGNDNTSVINFTNSEYLQSPHRLLGGAQFPQLQQLHQMQQLYQPSQTIESQQESNGIYFNESLRNQIKLYKMARQGQQNQQGQGEEEHFQDEVLSESSDYIEEISYSPLTYENLLKQLEFELKITLPRLDLKQIKIDRSKMLGRGTEGIVFLCSIGNCQNLAVKVLQDIDNQWAKEILTTTDMVQNQKIKGIFSYDYYSLEHSRGSEINCNLYMVSRRMRCDLVGATKTLKLNDNEKIYISLQISNVLSQLEGNIVHGDLKPSNILLDSDNNISVIDFGMSRVLSKSHNHLVESNSHTYLYSPPEQVLYKQAHQKSDIWSFGIIVFEMFTDRQMSQDIIYEMGMYDENKLGSLKIKQQPKDEFQKVIFNLIDSMTQFDYDKRPSMKAIQETLQYCQTLIQKPVQTTPPTHVVHSAYKLARNHNSSQNRKSAQNQGQLMVLGKQMKYQPPLETRPINQAQTHISNKNNNNIGQQKYPTQITKK